MVLSDSYESVFAFIIKQSGVAQLVWAACKAFYIKGSDKAGVASYFSSYLQSVTKFLRLTLDFMWNSAPREKFNHYISTLFC